jgi:hypothetical protein
VAGAAPGRRQALDARSPETFAKTTSIAVVEKKRYFVMSSKDITYKP